MNGADRERIERLIDAWDPASEELSDEVALAMDADEALRARFDARFARWEAPAGEAPPDLAARVLPRRRVRWARPLALAAAALLVVGVGSSWLLVAGYQREVDLARSPGQPVVISPLAPVPARDERRNSLRRPVRDQEAKQMIMELGYLDGDVDMRGDGFVDPGIGGSRDPRQEPLSTFSVDVDRGSYAWARRQLTEGRLPDPASVRTEEFVNALAYDYPDPEDGPFTVVFDGAPSPTSAETLVRVGLQAKRAARQPVHLTFLVDTSGSMRGPDRLPLVQQALGLLVDALGPQDTVAITTYAGSAGVALPPTAASDRARIHRALAALDAGGSTAMGEGIALAYRLAEETLRPGSTSRVILASDGDANVGVTDPGALTELIRRYADRGVALTTLGFGEGNYQDFRMEQLADDGDGNYFYVDGIAEARRVFVDELTSTLQTVARDVKVQVEWNPAAVERYRLVGYENRALAAEEFRDDRVDAGDVGAGHSVTALYAITLRDGDASPIATVRVRAKPPGPDAPSSERRFVLPRGAVHPSFGAASPSFRMAVGAALFAEHLRRSPFASEVRLAEVADVIGGARRADHPLDDELLGLVHRADSLER